MPGSPDSPADGVGVAEPATLVAELAALIAETAGESAEWAAAITAATRIHDDLELESVELAALDTALRNRYGPAVRLDRYLTGLELTPLIELTVGDLARHVARCRAAGAPGRDVR